jgi:hypothetical protein
MKCASPQVTSELPIDRQHHGLVGDLLARVQEGDAAARERTVRIRIAKIQEPAGAKW